MWQNNPQSKQYISYLKGKQGRRINEYFRDFIGCQEGIDGPGETRTLLKALSDFVESEDMVDEAAREKTNTLVDYSMAQAKLGEPTTLDELSGLIDEDRPKNFYDFIKAKDYGLSETLPPDKKTLSKFRRFTGRAEGMSISFEAHLLGDKIEFEETGGTCATCQRNSPISSSALLPDQYNPRHKFEITGNVAREFRNRSLFAAQKKPNDEPG